MRSFYVAGGVMPKTTDLGHHMYWSKYITDYAALPIYGIPDFIIGEHIIFAAISLVSDISYISTLPVIITLLINVFSLFSLFILAFEIAKQIFGIKHAKKIALLSFFIIGVLYAISSPGASYISGGVIGNILGNLFIPLAFYCLVRLFKTKEAVFAQLFLIFAATLAYTHHLSTFIFLYSLGASFLLTIALLIVKNKTNIKKTAGKLHDIMAPFFSAKSLFLLLVIAIFVFFIRTPSYLNFSAIDTAVGSPFKATRTGLSLNSIISSAGPWRFFFGFLGIVFVSYLFLIKKRTSATVPTALILGWTIIIFLMSWKPALLKVDINSNRIANYITIPLSILASIGIYFLVYKSRILFNRKLFTLIFLIFISTAIIAGFSDLSDSARQNDPESDRKVKQTFLASQYLSDISAPDENIIKDHIYLEGDTWIKLFFMRGYDYPLSRSYLKRYEDPAKDRETCTRDMIAIPDSQIGKACFDQNNVRFVMVNNGKDSSQFEKSQNFNKIYSSDHILIFDRKTQ